MKVAVKILILVMAVTLAIGGILIYAKTKVEPPLAPKQTNQYLNDLSQSNASLSIISKGEQEDSILLSALSRTHIFAKESKITNKDADKEIDILLGKYSSLFLKRSLTLFEKSTWNTEDHKDMQNVIGSLLNIKHSDGTDALKKSTRDSLMMVENIISRYNQARAVSKRTHFSGVSNAQSTISQARQFANDSWLSNCTDLVRDLRGVKSSLAESHYNYVSSMVEKLAQYRSFSQNYYDNTLVPQVDAAVTEYDNKASALYGSKKDVNALWNRAKNYYNEASLYYN